VPVVTCPQCPTRLKIPDGVSGNTKCPKCGTIFPVVAAPDVGTGTKPAFGGGVAPAQKPPPAPKPAPQPAPKPAPAPAAKPPVEEPDFEVVDEKPKKRVIAVEEDDDRPRKKKRYDDDDDDDDYDDEPRARKKRYDKPKKKKKSRYDDDDDDDDWQPKSGARAAFSKGKTGALLISISFWLNLATYGMLSLYALLLWIMLIAATSSSPSSRGGMGGRGGGGGGVGGESLGEVLVVLPGLLGLGAWIVGLVGSSFSIAGPAKARGMAITATVLSGVHLVLMGVTFSNLHGGGGGFGPARGMGVGIGSVAWLAVSSALPVLDTFLPMLFYHSGMMSGDYIIGLLAAVCEVARLIFMLYTLKAMANAARDYEVAEKAQFGILTASFVIGGVAIAILALSILLSEGGIGIKTVFHLSAVAILLTLLAYTFMMLSPALTALQTRNACDRRS